MQTGTFKKIGLWLLVAIIGFVALVIIFISPITKYLVEKYDTKFTGREVKMDWAYVNPFTGYLHFDGLKIFECESDTVFISVAGLSLNFEMLKALSGVYEISKITLNKPWGRIVQNGKQFNFSDLIVQFGPKEAKKDTAKREPVKFNLLNVTIENGEFHFFEKTIPIVYHIKNVEAKCTGKRWDSDETGIKLAFESGTGSGKIALQTNLNISNLDYKSTIRIRNFNMQLLAQYLKEISNYGTLGAILDADIQTTGNLNDPQKTDARMKFDLSDFHFGKNIENDYAAFEHLKVKINRLSPSKGIYDFDSIQLHKPYFKFERYDSLDNIENMFGVNGSKVKKVNSNEERFNLILEIAKYLRQLTENLLAGQYQLKSMIVSEGNILYNDYTPREKFSVAAQPFHLKADHIDKTKNHGDIEVNSGMKPYGKAHIKIQVYPKNQKDFDFHYYLAKLPLTLFNPFIVTATSFPLDRGSLELKGDWHVKNGKINSENRLTLIDPRTGKRVKKSDTRWIPVPLIFAILRERGNVIDYKIPIHGNLNNPKFNLWDPVLDVLGNIFIKPPTIPYGLHVRNVENKLEKSINIKWAQHSHELSEGTEKFIKKMVDFLEDNPDSQLDVHASVHEEKEKEFIEVYEAKKLYFLHKFHKTRRNFTTDDSLGVEKMANKEAGFLAYLNKRISDSLLFTVQHKSMNVVGEKAVDAKYAQLLSERKKLFLSYFPENIRQRLIFYPPTSIIPFNGQSLYEISYKGDVPENLRKDYSKYNDLSDDLPRAYFKKKRKFREVFF